MAKKKLSRCLWNFGLIYESELLSKMASRYSRRSGYDEITGDTPNITEWTDFEFYYLVWWFD